MVFFFFVCDFGTKKQGANTSPRFKGSTSAETRKSATSREKRYIKLKPREQVKEKARETSVVKTITVKILAVILETPKSTKENISKVRGKTQESQPTNHSKIS